MTGQARNAPAMTPRPTSNRPSSAASACSPARSYSHNSVGASRPRNGQIVPPIDATNTAYATRKGRTRRVRKQQSPVRLRRPERLSRLARPVGRRRGHAHEPSRAVYTSKGLRSPVIRQRELGNTRRRRAAQLLRRRRSHSVGLRRTLAPCPSGAAAARCPRHCRANTGDKLRGTEVDRASSASSPCSTTRSAHRASP
jgi:hypothetical protein